MRVHKITLREIHLRLLSPFQTSFGTTDLRRILLVEAEADGGVAGWGESTAGEHPFYSYESIETAWYVLRDYLWPIVRGREIASASEVLGLFAQVRGHNMAKAALETALWDIEAKQKNMPLAKLLGGTRAEIPCGVSIGIQPTMDRADRESRGSARRRIPAHQDQNQAGNGHRAGADAARALSASAPDGGCEFGLYA